MIYYIYRFFVLSYYYPLYTSITDILCLIGLHILLHFFLNDKSLRLQNLCFIRYCIAIILNVLYFQNYLDMNFLKMFQSLLIYSSILISDKIVPYSTVLQYQVAFSSLTMVLPNVFMIKKMYCLSLYFSYFRNSLHLIRVIPLSIICVYLERKNVSKYLIWTVILSIYMFI